VTVFSHDFTAALSTVSSDASCNVVYMVAAFWGEFLPEFYGQKKGLWLRGDCG